MNDFFNKITEIGNYLNDFFNKITEIVQVNNGKSGVNLLLQENLEICINTKHCKGLKAKSRFSKIILVEICKSASTLGNIKDWKQKADFPEKIWTHLWRP